MYREGVFMINYVVIGSGWRAEFYLRIAKLVPEVFCVTAMCVRNDEKAKYFENKYGVKTFRTVEETLKEKSDFAVVLNEKVFTTQNKKKAKSALKIAAIIAAIVLAIEVVSMVIFFSVNGLSL